MSLRSSSHAKKLEKFWANISARLFTTVLSLKAAAKSRKTLSGRIAPILAVRLTAIFLILAFIIPGFFLGDAYKSSAKGISISQAAPISAAPEAFSMGGGHADILQSSPPGLRRGGRVSRTGWSIPDRITGAAAWVSAFFGPAKLPEGFEAARVPTFGNKVGAALASMLGEAPDFGLRLNPPAYAGGSDKSALNPPAYAGGSDKSTLNPPAYAGGSDKSAPSNLERSTGNLELGTLNLEPALAPAGSVTFDFDGDGKADLGRWHSATTEFKVKNSNGGAFATSTIGTASAKPAPADFDGDGRTDAAVFDAGTWTIKRSSDGQTTTITGFGQTGDKPVAGNYTGAAAAELAVYRPSSGTWYFREVGNATVTSTQFGATGDIAVPGNYDGDSVMDFAVFRPSTGQWHFLNTNGYSVLQWGVASDIPVAADYDGDNKTDLAVYRGTSGDWWILKSSTGNTQWNLQTWGNFGDQPTPADYDGDGRADYSVWRPTTGVWHTIKSGTLTYDYQTLGVAGDTAVSSAYLKQIGGQVSGYDLAQARLSPRNATGGTDLYSRNFSWGTSLVGLSGRAGLGAGFGMSYISLVWTKSGSEIYFDANADNISPGFRFGFPTIEPAYYNTATQKFSYLMVTPSGGRVEFRQTGASQTYETADSSYVQLTTKGADSPNDPVEDISITLTGTDGTKMSYQWKAGAYRCSQIKDRNGNYITINHDEQGSLRTVTDTLGRVITVEYDTELFPTAIKQTWRNNNGSGSDVVHTWASFSYATKEISTNFAGLTVVGPPNGTVLKVLEKVTYPDSSFTQFDYNSYGQVFKVRNVAADSTSHVLNYVRTNLETPSANQTDCPRFTETRSWVENFNGGSETVVTNSVTTGQSYSTPAGTGTATKIEVSMANHPHNAVSRNFVGESGWMEGLPIVTEDWADGTSGTERKRWTSTSYTQDGNADILSAINNPRIIESKVGDTANIKKTTVEYRLLPNTTIAEYGLVRAVNVYDTNQTTILKRAETDYNLSSSYISKRIIGLPSETRAYGYENSQLPLVSKMTYAYDEGDFSDTTLNQNISPVQHDNAAYGASFIIGRGNPTSTTRWNVEYPTSSSYAVTSSVKYNTAGAPVSQTDPLSRTVKIGYAITGTRAPCPQIHLLTRQQ